MKPNPNTAGNDLIMPPAVDPGRLSDDVRALLERFDHLTSEDLEFTRFQFELWDRRTDDGPLLISALREPTSQKDASGLDTFAWQLTGQIVPWDFDQEHWAWRKPLLRFYCFDELSAWLQERFAPGLAEKEASTRLQQTAQP